MLDAFARLHDLRDEAGKAFRQLRTRVGVEAVGLLPGEAAALLEYIDALEALLDFNGGPDGV